MAQKVFFFHFSFFTLVLQITYQEHVVEIPQVQTVERIRQVPKIVTLHFPEFYDEIGYLHDDGYRWTFSFDSKQQVKHSL